MIMTYKMHQRLIHERDVAHSLAENLIRTAEELHVSPAYLLDKVESELTTTMNARTEDVDSTGI